jgi:PAS domain S-box-containing protein
VSASIKSLISDDVTELLGGLQSADGVFCIDGSQRIIYWSLSAEQILGHAADDVLGQPCYEVLGGRESQNHRFCRRNCPIVTNARRGRPTGDYDVLTRAKDGSDVWINISILLLKTERRGRPLVLHLFRDVTGRRRVEGLARRALEALRELGAEAPAPEGPEVDAGSRPTPLPALSTRELQVLQLLASGLTTEQIAENLSVSPVTARNHITHLVTKLGARNRLQAVLYASRRRLI